MAKNGSLIRPRASYEGDFWRLYLPDNKYILSHAAKLSRYYAIHLYRRGYAAAQIIV